MLIDITYGSLKQLLDSITMGNHGYLYLVSPGGQLIYHPQMQLNRCGADAGKLPGCCRLPGRKLKGVLSGRDPGCDGQIGGLYRLEAGGRYTGKRKLSEYVKDQTVYGISDRAISVYADDHQASISSALPSPIRELEKSVNALENGNLDVEVYQGGSYEIRHLGRSIGDMARQIKVLMQDIVASMNPSAKANLTRSSPRSIRISFTIPWISSCG